MKCNHSYYYGERWSITQWCADTGCTYCRIKAWHPLEGFWLALVLVATLVIIGFQ